MEIKPDKKYMIKLLYVLLTFSVVFLLVAVIFQVLLPLKPALNAGEVAAILWPIYGGVIMLMWLISVPILRLWIKNLSYYIEQDRITIHKGILTKVQQNIPYREITDFQLHRMVNDSHPF